MESVIKWQTGDPKENGLYIVAMKCMHKTFVSYSRYSCLNGWLHSNKVLAWCKFSDIEPYKEDAE